MGFEPTRSDLTVYAYKTTSVLQHELGPRPVLLEIDLSGGCLNPGEAKLYCPDCGQPFLLITRCGKRFACQCPSCSKRWREKNRKLIERGLETFRTPKFMTLTLRKVEGRGVPIERHAESRNALFHRLRRDGYRIRGWMSVIEPPNHQHLVIDCDYVPQNTLSKYWKTVTGDSYIVDIRRVAPTKDGLKGVARYMAKYLTKGCEVDLSLAEQFHGKRFFQSWGVHNAIWHNPICSCGNESGRLFRLHGVDWDAYVEWWESSGTTPPPVS